jgi:hypothetical protein
MQHELRKIRDISLGAAESSLIAYEWSRPYACILVVRSIRKTTSSSVLGTTHQSTPP